MQMEKDFRFKKIFTGIRSICLIYITSISSGFTQAGPDPLPQYLLNLGSSFGYDISTNPPAPVNKLLDGNGKSIQSIQQADLLLILGTIFSQVIVDPASGSPFTVLNSNQSAGSGYNSGNILQKPPYNAPSSNGALSVNPMIDQQPYQNNPVSQTILDMLTTPDFSYCTLAIQSCGNNSSTPGSLASKCCGSTLKYQQEIGMNVLGGVLPDPANIDTFFTLDPSIIKQLNSNSLIAPMLYSTSNSSSTSGSASGSTSSSSGLTAVSQVQEAANFIRYVSAALAPPTQTNLATYQTLYNQAMASPTTAAGITKTTNAQQALTNYIASLRTVAAQTSVGVANLYEILAKRVSQTPPGATNPTSQALNEYYMATRRLYDPTKQKGSDQAPQWIEQINVASPATIQKEIAILLSEINYQLYLSRQQQERLLLTNSVMLFQLAHTVQPQPLQAPQ